MWKNFYIHFCLKFWYQAISWLISQNYKITFLVVLHELHDANITECAPQKCLDVRLKTCKCIIIQVLIDSESHTTCILEPVCCKKQQKKGSWPVTGLHNRGPLKDLNDSKLIVYESRSFPWLSRINFIPFRIFRFPILQTSNWSGTFFCCFLQQTGSRWYPWMYTYDPRLKKLGLRIIFQPKY